MNIHEKLLEIQKRVDKIIKDERNLSDKYDFVSNEHVLEHFRPLMNEYGLLLIPVIERAELHEGTTKSGTTRFMTEIWPTFTWYDVESGEEVKVPWYGQGTDLAGERGVGKAVTYAEKIFFLKFFHIPTKKDDPDNDARTRTGEKNQKGTAAAKENVSFCRAAIPQMLNEIYSGDQEKIRAGYIALTKSDARGYAGVDDLDSIKDTAIPVVYGKLKKQYEKRMGQEFQLKPDEAETIK